MSIPTSSLLHFDPGEAHPTGYYRWSMRAGFEINISVPLVLEYEDVLNRLEFGFSSDDIRNVVDYLCTIGNRHHIHFLWRPYLNDPKDDLVLELAVTARCHYIVTFNERDFRDLEQFGLQAIRPIEFLKIIGEIP